MIRVYTQNVAEVYDLVMKLRAGEKRQLYRLLSGTLQKEQEKIDKTNCYNKILNSVEKVLKQPMDFDSRKFPFTTARQYIAWQAMKEGLSSNEAGKFIRKNHTSVCWMRVKVDDILKYPFSYDKESRLITKFITAYETIK